MKASPDLAERRRESGLAPNGLNPRKHYDVLEEPPTDDPVKLHARIRELMKLLIEVQEKNVELALLRRADHALIEELKRDREVTTDGRLSERGGSDA